MKKSDKISGIGVSEILQITAQAVAAKAAGQPMIILGAGEPDFDTPQNVKETAWRAIQKGETKYTALGGTPQFKEAICYKYQKENGLDFSASEVMGAAGAKQIIYNAMAATLNDGDEVLIPAPYWTSYIDIIRFCGGVPVCLPTREEDNFCLQSEDLARSITPKTRWLFLNSPSNPTGATYSEQSLLALAEVIRQYPTLNVLSDDIYEHIVYDGLICKNLLQVAPDLRQQILLVNGVSKAYAMTGWRIGFAAAPVTLIRAMTVVQSQTTSCPCSVSQAAAIEALTGPQTSIAERVSAFQERRNFVVDALNEMKGISCAKPTGAFYTFASSKRLVGLRTPQGNILKTDRDFAHYLMAHNVAVVPGSCFGKEGYFRISYAASQQDLQTALQRIQVACSLLQQV